MAEFNDIYDKNRRPTGKVHLRGTSWSWGEYGMVTCVWIYDGKGNVLLTKRAPEKSFGGTWENTGGAVRAGENTREGIARELMEETGICAKAEDFEFLGGTTNRHMHFDHYCLHSNVRIEDIRLQPGETVDVRWFSFEEVHKLIRKGKICRTIAFQFIRFETALLERTIRFYNAAKEKA